MNIKSINIFAKYLNRRQWAFLLVILLMAIIAIVWFMPRDSTFGYRYVVGKPWAYATLTASHDFPILKAEAQLQHERDSLHVYHRPYVRVDMELGNETLRKLRADYKAHLATRLPVFWRPHVERLMASVYQAGILDASVYESLRYAGVHEVMFVRHNTATPVLLSSIYTPKTAYRYLLEQDTINYPAAQMRAVDLNVYLQANLTYDSLKSETALQELLATVSPAVGMVQAGQRIVDKGEIVSPAIAAVLESMEQAAEKRTGSSGKNAFLLLLGQVIFVVIVFSSYLLYIVVYRRDYVTRHNVILLMFTLITGFTVLTYMFVHFGLTNVYIIPFAMIPIVLHVLLDSRTAFMAYFTTIMLCSVAMTNSYQFVILQMLAGVVAAFGLHELTRRSQLFYISGVIVCFYSLIYGAMCMVSMSNMSAIDPNMFLDFIINGILLLLAYPLLYGIERIFGFTSNVALVELSDTNNKLLRRLSEEAPGTFHHTIQVSNLAAAAADRIGVNAQLVRTGALYHDIGKLQNPQFFTENQSGVNPNDQLSYEQAAKVVIAHVADGLRLAEQAKLPRLIKDFIATHHGKGVAKYFLVSWQNEHPGQEPDWEKFSYPGPNPQTSEAAILMMADSVEAASRSLKECTDENLTELINRIIDSQIEAGYFQDTPLTFRDITQIKAVFREKLRSIYHLRVSYPEAKTPV